MLSMFTRGVRRTGPFSPESLASLVASIAASTTPGVSSADQDKQREKKGQRKLYLSHGCTSLLVKHNT
jgi:hypothetical protein